MTILTTDASIEISESAALSSSRAETYWRIVRSTGAGHVVSEPQSGLSALTDRLARMAAATGATHFLAPGTAILRSFSEILFLNGAGCGAVMLAATCFHPPAALGALVSTTAAYVAACLLGAQRTFLSSGAYSYNAVLVGLGLGCSLQLSGVALIFFATTGVLTLLLTIAFSSALRVHLALPVLSLPFVVASAAAYLASLRYSNLLVHPNEISVFSTIDAIIQLPLWCAGFFRSLGAVLFLPYVCIGFVFAGLLAWQSRILVLLAIAGYGVGTAVRGMLLGSSAAALGDLSGFNFVLIAMAVGGVYLIPSSRSYAIAMLAVATSAVLIDTLQVMGAAHNLPVYTLPFNLITLAVLYSAAAMSYPGLALQIGRTPEATLDADLARRNRFSGELRTLRLPFFGSWTVWQAFDDIWTHKGAWRYAYDFVITDESGKTFSGGGGELTDYFCFGKPVVSPVRGRVVTVINDLPDQPVGRMDNDNNWGNHVVILDDRGIYVELSHFLCGSIRVIEGEWVTHGTTLGLCGNSGYSPQPHLHVQVQMTASPTSGTLPFRFSGYVTGDTYYLDGCPQKSSVVRPSGADPQLDGATDFCLDEWYDYQLVRTNRPVLRTRLNVCMSPDGTFYFAATSGAKLFFAKHDGVFYFFRLDGEDEILRRIFEAVPRLPLAFSAGLSWNDSLPISIACTGALRSLATVGASIVNDYSRIDSRMTFARQGVIESQVTSRTLGINRRYQVEFGQSKGFATIRSGDEVLRRVSHGVY